MTLQKGESFFIWHKPMLFLQIAGSLVLWEQSYSWQKCSLFISLIFVLSQCALTAKSLLFIPKEKGGVSASIYLIANIITIIFVESGDSNDIWLRIQYRNALALKGFHSKYITRQSAEERKPVKTTKQKPDGRWRERENRTTAMSSVIHNKYNCSWMNV